MKIRVEEECAMGREYEKVNCGLGGARARTRIPRRYRREWYYLHWGDSAIDLCSILDALIFPDDPEGCVYLLPLLRPLLPLRC